MVCVLICMSTFPGLNDILAASLAEAQDDGSRPGGPPPAAKHAVAALPVEEVTAERLTELGGPGTECPVCRYARTMVQNPYSRAMLVHDAYLCCQQLCYAAYLTKR